MSMLELLMPAGNLKKLKTAVHFGADAVYIGGKNFSLRAFSDNFSDDEIIEALTYAHARDKKVYVAANIFAKDADVDKLKDYFAFLQDAGADAVLISDIGLMTLCREVAPDLPIHVSTQANALNSRTVKFYRDMGAARVVLARELSLEETARIHLAVPDIELEAFCHGAMCISYSGRCLLSTHFSGRSANKGECMQPCRFRYSLVEEMRPDLPLAIEEDERGTYIMNSKDLRLLSRIPEMAKAGVCSLKAEGRMKSEFYIAVVASAYRAAIDSYLATGRVENAPALEQRLERISHRPYTEAFFEGERFDTVSPDSTRTKEKEVFVATVLSYKDGKVLVEMRNRFFSGDTLNVLSPSAADGKTFTVGEICMQDGSVTDDAKLVQAAYSFDCPYPLESGDILTRDLKNA